MHSRLNKLRYNYSQFPTGLFVQRFLLLFLSPLFLLAAELHMPVQSVSEDGKSATVEVQQIAKGVHGFVVRHFTKEHSVIIADVHVSHFDSTTHTATLALSEYTGLKQNSLPQGKWKTQVGDEVILAFAYSRALLIAPDEETYHIITNNIHGVEWIHPDSFATFLSYRAHPTPFKEDISNYCTLAEIGLLYTYVDGALFTMDCQTLSLIQLTPVKLKQKGLKLPFYSRVEEIATSWWVWGAASNPLEAYDPHYLELIVEHNQESRPLYDYISTLTTPERELVEEFKIEE